jgi:hypothetical protein
LVVVTPLPTRRPSQDDGEVDDGTRLNTLRAAMKLLAGRTLLLSL